LGAAVWAPTAIHAEPWVFAVVQDRKLLQRVSDRAKAMWPAPAPEATEAHAAAHLPAGRAFAELLRQPDFNIFYDASTLIVIGARDGGASQFAFADCWLAAENLMLAACAYGLGTCVIGSALPALMLPDVKAELGIPDDVTPMAPIIVGVPQGPSPIPPARKAPEIVAWQRGAL
jgi:nitroreductase